MSLDATMAATCGYIVDLLQPPGRIMAPSDIERCATKELKVAPRIVTHALADMHPDPLTLTPFPMTGSVVAHAYSFGDPDPGALAQCREMNAARSALLSPEKLRDASERYVRAAIRHVRTRGASQYLSIPNPSCLGRIVVSDSSYLADLVVGYETEEREKINLLIEVKAHREHLDVTSGIFAPLIRAAIAANGKSESHQPVLIASHLTARAKSFCNAAGIAVHELGRRFLPRQDRREAKELWPTGWDELFQYIRLDRIFADSMRLDPRSCKDFEVFRERPWIEVARLQWLRLRAVHDQIAAALERRPASDWSTVRNLLPEYDRT